ncbi:MAG: hypothetical protein AAFU34_18150 [Pseudomonadota bacterium]
MVKSVKGIATIALVGSLMSVGLPDRLRAQTYPIDCAILLCLSGGWPASVPCSQARAEFIRRITPWPVEPPLQIWRCPMAASYTPGAGRSPAVRLYDIMIEGDETPLPYSSPFSQTSLWGNVMPAVFRGGATPPGSLPEGLALQLVQDRADIDISGPEFNFVRSIRVYDVRYARQRESGRDGDCNRTAAISLGTYGIQGDFSWSRSSPTALPAAHVGLERWGESCPNIWHRSVFVDWRDYEGNYGFEQVNY